LFPVARVVVLKTYTWLEESELPMTAQKLSRSNAARKDAGLLDFILTLLPTNWVAHLPPLPQEKVRACQMEPLPRKFGIVTDRNLSLKRRT
jgi:hypothetical protein